MYAYLCIGNARSASFHPRYLLLSLLLCMGLLSKSQDIAVNGKVADEQGQALSKVNISIKGTSTGTTTDVQGRYSITAAGNAVLVFSYTGYVTQEIPVNNRNGIIDVVLIINAQSLEDVVVTGYSSQRKKDITGSVAVVDMKALKSIPSGSAAQDLQGQAAGVNVVNSGVPGGDTNIYIRGITSFGNTQPLVLIDGVEGNLDNISSGEIESMQVLKDAGAASIYGVRGSNGVILVVTKKGKAGLPVITYDAYYGTQRPLSGNPFNLLNSEDFASLSKIAFPTSELFKNGLPDFLYTGPGVSGVGQAGDPAVDPSKYVLDPATPANNYLIQAVNKSGTDWFHEVFKPAPMQQHSLAVSGGTDKASYLFALNYLNQQGTMIETYQKRYSLRVNTQYKIRPFIRIGENLNVFQNDNPVFLNQSEGSPVSHIYRQMPIIPVYDIQGNYGGMFAGPDLGNAQNPVAIQKRTVNDRSTTIVFTGNIYAEIDFLKNFTIRSSAGGSRATRNEMSFAFNRYNDREGSTGLNNLLESSSYDRNLIWTNTLTYNNIFGKHSVRVLAGSEANKYDGRALVANSGGFFSTNFDYLILQNGTANSYSYSLAYENTLFSLFSRLDYSFSDKYLVSATIRKACT